jgi:ribonucleoside-diphosphate reductase alpha chain
MKRGKVLKGSTYKKQTGCGSIFVTINTKKEGEPPWEIFIRMGKSGGCASSQAESLGRTISLALQAGIDIKQLIKNLAGICCHSPAGQDADKVTSCADAISKVLKIHMEENVQAAINEPKKD